jgi:predicted N-acetyltransferase YhbS
MPIAAPASDTPSVTLRPIEAADAEIVARIVFDAFAGIHDRHVFARDFPTLEAASGMVDGAIAHPNVYGVVAEAGGRIIGSNFLDERGPVTGVGPISVIPDAQVRGVGRRLMQAVIERGARAAGIRLLQDAFNTTSFSLYASLGFEVKEPVVLLSGKPSGAMPAGYEVRPLQADDVPACEDLHRRVHGHERTAELRDALGVPRMAPVVALHDGRITAYATTLRIFTAAHAVGETDADLQALILGAAAASGGPVSFLLPSRQAALLRWSLAQGLRVVKPMTYMAMGFYQEPKGAWIPTILY